MIRPERLSASGDVVASEASALLAAAYWRFRAGGGRVSSTGLTSRMLGVLRHLAHSGPLTIGEQADHLGISRATVVEVIDRLEQRGLVARKRDERDRRRVFVWLTEDGRTEARKRPAGDEVGRLTTALVRMDAADRRGLLVGLRALVEASEEVERERRAPAV